jgi:putative nucleotidyltransferase with HDIG domain
MEWNPSKVPSHPFNSSVFRSFFKSIRLTKELFLGVIFTLSIAFFIHYREVQVENLELDSTAEKYVLAQVGFEFPDVEATSILKLESLKDVGNIYQIDDKLLLDRAESIGRHLVIGSEWRERLPDATFNAIYEGNEAVYNALLKSRFVDARTWHKMAEVGYPLEGCFIFTPELSADSAQNSISYAKKVLIPANLWESIREYAFKSIKSIPVESEVSNFIIGQYSGAKWVLRGDLAAQNAVKQLVKSHMLLKKTKVEPGSRIISAGEKVTARHIDMIKAMKHSLSDQQNLLTPLTLLASVIMAFIFTMLCVFYLKIEFPEIIQSFPKQALLTTIFILTLAIAKLTECIFLTKEGNWLEFFHFPIFILFGSILLTILLGSRLAFAASSALVVILCVTLSFERNHFLVINMTAALVAICSARNIRRRKEIFEVAAKVWLVLIPVIFAFNFFQDSFWTMGLLADIVATGLFIMTTTMMVVGIMPILESAFGIVTDMTLMEYVDPNHPLLRRLSIEAPGSYQHSLVVAAIAEEAALAINANALFCRVATLYHDIGKLSNPQYFTENQFAGFNIHQLLTPLESAQVITAHVTEGVTLGAKYSLPQSFLEVIQEHHGTTAVYCFYRAQLELVQGDRSKVDEMSFRYKGPKPRSKESAIIMISDTLEAASRSLDEVNEKSVEALIERLVGEKMADGQFDECQLTFEEMGILKKSIIRTILFLSHERVKYPTQAAIENQTHVLEPQIAEILLERSQAKL